MARLPKAFWWVVRDEVQRVRISSRDFEARRDVGGGAGPVVEAPRLAVGLLLAGAAGVEADGAG